MAKQEKKSDGGRNRYKNGPSRQACAAGAQKPPPANRGKPEATTDNRCRTGELTLEQVARELKKRDQNRPDRDKRA